MRSIRRSDFWGGRWIQIAAVVVVAACGSEREPLGTESGVSDVTSGPGPGSGPGPTSGEQPTGGTGGMTEGSSTETGGGAPTREVCEKYLDCIAVATPEALPGAQMGFGPNGTCWDGPPESIEQCITACVAGLDTLRLANLDIAQCVDCLDAAGCDGELVCFEGLCVDGYCGDEIVAEDEVCDHPEYDCGPMCQHKEGSCNPLSNTGCVAGESCIIDYYYGRTGCVLGEELLGAGEVCVPGSEFCALGQSCAPVGPEGDCSPGPGEGCCVSLCNLQEPDSCTGGRTCTQFILQETPFKEWENYVGVCAPS